MEVSPVTRLGGCCLNTERPTRDTQSQLVGYFGSFAVLNPTNAMKDVPLVLFRAENQELLHYFFTNSRS